MIRLENWSLVCANPDPYQPPEAQVQSMHGNVYGHARFQDGDEITTTPIKRINVVDASLLVHTRNSVYELGSVDPQYEAAYPNARARLVKAASR